MNFGKILVPPLTDPVKYILNPLTDFEKTIDEYFFIIQDFCIKEFPY